MDRRITVAALGAALAIAAAFQVRDRGVTAAPVRSEGAVEVAAPATEPMPDVASAPATRARAGLVREAAADEDVPDRYPRLEALLAWIDALSREELALALSGLTGMDHERLLEERDLREVAREVARIGLAGITGPPNEAPAPEIDFGSRLRDALDPETASDEMSSAATRMFGVFDLEPGGDRELLTKWYRVDPPELLMFEAVPVRAEDGRAFIRLDRREGWEAGEYRLEVYEAGGGSELVAAGGFRTTGTGGPLRVSFQRAVPGAGDGVR